MKKIAAIILALALCPSLASAAQETGAASATSAWSEGGHIYVVSGDVYIARGEKTPHRVTNDEVIGSDTMISTGENSAALLRFEDGQIVTMQSNSAFQVRQYRYDANSIENSHAIFSMFKGGLRFVTGLIGQRRKQAFRLATPTATIGIRGTEFMVAMVGDSTYSQVLNGKITMTNAAGMKVLGMGQSAVVSSSRALASLVPASAIPADTFIGLLSIPVDPSEIPAPAPAPAPVPVPVPVPVPEPIPEPVPEPVPAPVPAPEPTPEPAKIDTRSGIGLTVKAGTLGGGAELSFGSSDRFSARVGLNAYDYKRTANSGTVNYDFELQLQTASVLADWYPFSGRFRASGGLFYNNNEVSLSANPTGGNYTINGATYSSTQIGSLKGTMTFNKAAPYLGIGWGNPVAKDKGWGMTSDFGVLFQGEPKTSLTATCNLAPCSAAIQNNVAAENTKMQSDLSNFKWWPVVSIGISYQW